MTKEEIIEKYKDAYECEDCYGDKFIMDLDKVKEDNCGNFYIEYNHQSMIVYSKNLYNGTKSHFAKILSYKSDIKPPQYQIGIVDPIVTSVMTQLLTRSQLGISKYGTTLKDNNTDDFLQHLKEELMDAILYIEKLQSLK